MVGPSATPPFLAGGPAPDGVDDLIARIEGGGVHRVLRRLAIQEGPTGVAVEGDTSVGIALDVETTGTDLATDVITELALRRFRYDGDGRIVAIDRAWSWLEDPGQPLEPEVARLTGLTDGDLAGQALDEERVVRLLRSADVVVAHNASFDRRFVERRLPDAAGLAWACSCREIDWRARGFDGRSLGHLLLQAGWYHDGHRAQADVDALIQLLRTRFDDGTTALAELVETASCPSVRIEAVGAAFEVKERLRARGYKWDGDGRVWWREVQASDLVAEEFWLARSVYDLSLRPRCLGPRLTQVTWRERHG